MSISRKALTFGVALAALCATTASAFAVTAYATSPVNVRNGPGTGYRIVDSLRRGERVDIDYCRVGWCFVNKSGPDGWVSANFLSRRGVYRAAEFYGDDDFYIDRYPVRRYPFYRRYDPGFSACFGGPNARFCLYD